MSTRLVTQALAIVLVAGLTQVPAQAAELPKQGPPVVAGQHAPADGRGMAPEKQKTDPSAERRMSKPDTYMWPEAKTTEIVSESRAGKPVRMRVQWLNRTASEQAGVAGPIMRIIDGSGRFSVSYDKFAHAYGGNWGSRLRLVQLPACALVDPGAAQCRTVTPLASANDADTQTLSADVRPGMVVAVTAADASAQGDYKATALSPSSTWDTSLSSGGFSWNYPIRVPGVPGGLTPQVALAYSSQSVDGRTSATNNQGSWMGEGFSYEPGYIERRYQPCSEDGHTGSGEKCWAFQNATIMLQGRSGPLVKIDDNNWKVASDDGSKVERLTGASNGDNDGEYWKLTTVDGTQYFFGLNKLPGWATGNEETESAWTQPIYGDDANEPCYQSSGFTNSSCDQAWRWSLDHVINPGGSVISYFYDRETNHYAKGGRTDINGSPYIRAGYLARIDYGQRENQVYSTNAPARVVFTTAERCVLNGTGGCASYPDVPEDLVCAPDTHCKSTQASQTYFTRKRLAKIETQIRQATSWMPVESWGLEHVFYNNDDLSKTLWLKKLVHSGHWNGTTQSKPPIEFDGIQLPNRVDSPTDGVGPLVRFRMATIKSETGSQMSINYAPVDCFAGSLPTPGTSTKRCYPVRWNPFGGAETNEIVDWFHKYIVSSVVNDDLVGGNPDMVTSYQQVGGAAWVKPKPDGMTKDKYVTWSEWRGYDKVIVRTGDGQIMPTRVDHVFMRGLGGTVTDSTGKSYNDHDDFFGSELETTVYNGSELISKTISEPLRRVTHTHNETWGTQEAAFVKTETVRNLTSLPGNAWRENKTVTTYDPIWGRVTSVSDLSPAGNKCNRTWYIDNPGKYMYSYVSREQKVGVDCGTTANLNTHLIADSRTSYDLTAWNIPPTKGVATRTEDLDRFDGTNVVYLVKSEMTTVDVYGRELGHKNAIGKSSTSEYTESYGLTTQLKSTNELGQVVYTNKDPAFGATTSTVDFNSYKIQIGLDVFGRMTAVWLADRNAALGASPSLKFTYLMRPGKPYVTLTEKLNNDGTYRPSYDMFDGMLRVRQKQEPGPNGTWLLVDTFYDGTGKSSRTNGTYAVTGTAGDLPIVVPDGSTNSNTFMLYDGAGRLITETAAVAGEARWSTITVHYGDHIDADLPAGGISTTTVVNARGDKTAVYQYKGDSPSGPADVARYEYDMADRLVTVIDQLNNTWRYEYDQRGQRKRTRDVDSGDMTYTYDAAGKTTSTTDSRGVKLSTRYDDLGRKTEVWQGELDTGTKLASHKYDSYYKGQLSYSTRHTAGGNYSVGVTSRDKLYRPLTTRYWVPNGDIGGELGITYDFTTAYNTDGTMQSAGMPAAGGLPAESIVTSYDSLMRPTALTGTTSYARATSFDTTGRMLQAELYTGGTNKKAWLTWQYERGTNRLLKSTVDRQGIATPDRDATYSYDASGNVKSIADTPVSGPRDIQCFQYDYLRRLSDAFATASTDADPCATGSPGGPAAYHQSWTYDETGNRKVEILFGMGGAANTQRTYYHPAQGQGQNQPHKLTKIEETGPGGAKTHNYGYDTAGNTTDRPNQTLKWDSEGHLEKYTPSGASATTYVYDSDGDRLVRKEPGAITLYLQGMELRLDTATRVVTGTRFYTFAGSTVAVRNTTGVHFQASDHHETAVCSINAATGAITTRRATPFGANRGTGPASWPDQKGFVGGTQDSSGLTHLGAREYDPLLGRFISVDSIIDIYDPQQMHGYAYSNSNPMSFSDPDGKLLMADGGGGSTRYDDGGAHAVLTPAGPRSRWTVARQVRDWNHWDKLGWAMDGASGFGWGTSLSRYYWRGQSPAKYAGGNWFKRATNAMDRGSYRISDLATKTRDFFSTSDEFFDRTSAGARNLSRLGKPDLGGKALKVVGQIGRSGVLKAAGPALSVVTTGFDVWSEIEEGKDPTEAVIKGACKLAGSIAGGMVGASIATGLCGGFPLCGVVGGAVGGFVGGEIGGWIGEKIAPGVASVIKAPVQVVKSLCFWCKK